MSSRLGYSVGLDGVESAVGGLGRVKTAQDGVAAGTANVGQQAMQGAQHLQGIAAAVSNLAGRMGAPGVATSASLIGSIAGTTAQFAGMGAVMGPGGALAGAIVGLVVGLGALVVAQTDASAAAHAHRVELDALATAAIAARTAAAVDADVAAGTGTGAQMQLAVERARQQAQQAAANIEFAERALARIQTLGDRDGPLGALGSALFGDAMGDDAAANTQRILDQQRAMLATALAEVSRIEDGGAQRDEEMRIASEEEANAAILVARRAGLEEQRALEITTAATAADWDLNWVRQLEDQREAVQVESRAAAEARDARRQTQMDAAALAMSEQADGAIRLAAAEEEAAQAVADAWDTSMTERADGAIRLAEAQTAAEQIGIDSKKRALDAQLELTTAAEDAAIAFSGGYVNSLDQVLESWRAVERTSKSAGTAMLAQGRLLERGMVAVGNNIAETIGGDMTAAFTKALDAWLDGSLSFVEAAEQMAAGVIRSLVTESIVQAVVEGARAIASIASQDYVGAATHAAAAAAWAAVGVVAGGVAAGIGAVGGGGGGAVGGSATAADAGRERERDRAEGGGNLTLYVMPGGYITTRDVRAGLVQALNEAAREGVLPSFAGR